MSIDDYQIEVIGLNERIERLEHDNERLKALIGSPYHGAWTDEVLIEAAHQVERWGIDHDIGKEPQDWFWLVGYLSGKALRASIDGDLQKARHHTVSSAAVLVNWAAHINGVNTVFRPGHGAEWMINEAIEDG